MLYLYVLELMKGRLIIREVRFFKKVIDMNKIERRPDGTYWLEIDQEEINVVTQKIRRNEELDDRELTIAREFQLF
jgi:hypothetical protein